MANVPFVIEKVTAVPTAPTSANSVYLYADPAKPDYVELYAATKDGTKLKRVINEADVTTIVNNAIISNNGNKYDIVATITARDALTDKTKPVFVVDASADTTVTTGGAYYLWDGNNSVWIKTAEAESMDMVFNWSDIQNKPNSTVAQIDAAVSASHSHTNKTQLDKIGQDASGNMTYNGKVVATTINDAW